MSRRRQPARVRVGRVSVYRHHNAWWLYYREQGKPVRRKVGIGRDEALQVAAQVNAQLASGAPTLLAFQPISVPDLRREYLDHHEHVLASSLSTVRRYRAATEHLERFSQTHPRPPAAHEVRAEAFARYLRETDVAPNGHPHATKRKLRDKGVIFILETCRAMYAFAGKRRHLPPYAGNPFAELPLDRLKREDAKPIFVFDPTTELAFFQAADAWSFPLHFVLSKTGARVGELTHALIEEMDLDNGWWHIRNKPGLGWRIKTGQERSVPLLAEVVAVLRRVIGVRPAGPVFLRPRFTETSPPSLVGDRAAFEALLHERRTTAGPSISRTDAMGLARSIWREAGATKADMVRQSFIRTAEAASLRGATCPKSWRHTFATLLQDANVDPLVRQITLGHRPSTSTGLGMTNIYTHTRPETQRRQVEQALRTWPASLEFAHRFAQGGAS